ncbi:hypothetical protein pEaSNUABM11_00171 [Erwinia phage pEa_SNUABM_11]|nr:hypothetical protein pEaSNUABM11_00171 [Erwinia phage pEa_SNUABM_11]
MTIRVSWPSQADKALTSIEIYRKVGHSATIDVNNPGTPIATVAGTATQYVEDVANLTEKTVYTYWVAAVKGTERLFSAPIVQGFYLDTGPGPQKLLMGDWYAGYFGFVSTTDFASRDDIIGASGGLTAAQIAMFNASGFTGWYKFVFKGRILFFPNKATGYNTIHQTYNAGLVYGVDGNGSIVPTSGVATAQNAMFTKNGYRYRVRLPYYTDYDKTNGTDYDSGEWRNTMARMFATTYNFSTTDQGKFASQPILTTGSSGSPADPGSSAMAPLYGTTTTMHNYGYNPTAITYDSNASYTWYMFFVFELVLP